MELLYSQASPFARKVRISMIELKLEERVAIKTLSSATDPIVAETNPLAKIPALIRPGDTPLYDSYVICCFLDQLAGERLTAPISDRIGDLRLHALATGITEAAVNRVYETRRPPSEQSADWIKKWDERALIGCKTLEAEGPPPADFDTIGRIALACMLGYLDLRLRTDVPWRLECPRLAEWFLNISTRESFQATIPE